MTQVALVYNANSPLAQEVVRILAKRGSKVYAVDTHCLFYVNELISVNPELEGCIVPVMLNKEKMDIGSFLGGDKLDMVVDINLSQHSLQVEDFMFVSKLVRSSLVNKGAILAYGNTNAIKSDKVFNSLNHFVHVVKDDTKETDIRVVNLLDATMPKHTSVKDMAAFYMNSILRQNFKVGEIGGLKDLLSAAVYYGLPLPAYDYIDQTERKFDDWTSCHISEELEHRMIL